MDIFAQLVEKIIQEQANIIGSVAVEQAQKVPGLSVDMKKHEIFVKGDKKIVLEGLVEKYRDLFGTASVEVCKHAARDFIARLPKDQVPPLLLS